MESTSEEKTTRPEEASVAVEDPSPSASESSAASAAVVTPVDAVSAGVSASATAATVSTETASSSNSSSSSSSSNSNSDSSASSAVTNTNEGAEALRTAADAPAGAADGFDAVAMNEEVRDLDAAMTAKQEGNDYFRAEDFDNALEAYSRAIDLCPLDNKNEMAIFYGNRAACYFSIQDYEYAFEDCTDALKFNPKYVKVLVRRYQSLEKLDRLEEAVTDAKAVAELDPAYPRIQATITRLEKLNEERMNKMKEEAMGKLKELGNSVLGFMGMSLDDFKFQQDPNTGSWSVSTNTNKGQAGQPPSTSK